MKERAGDFLRQGAAAMWNGAGILPANAGQRAATPPLSLRHDESNTGLASSQSIHSAAGLSPR
jgi:hypothetical protein